MGTERLRRPTSPSRSTSRTIAARSEHHDAAAPSHLDARAGGPHSFARIPVHRSGDALPDLLRDRLESLSGLDLSRVRVHRNSPHPAALDARAYTQGDQIHLGPGHDRHLGHEAWHVVQQRQGRVRATARVSGAAVNDDLALEREAERVGGRLTSESSGERS
jgi:hypothetical protein